MDIYVSQRKNETFPFARTWMELVISRMLTEISQSEKEENHPVISLICGTERKKKQREKGKG